MANLIFKPNIIMLLSCKTVIRTKNFEASKAFYLDVMGLHIVETYDDGDGSRGLIFRFGDEKSNAFLEISEIQASHYYYQDAFGASLKNDKMDLQLRTEDMPYWERQIKEKWEARGPVLRPWGSHYLYLRDPDGLQIIIYQEKSGL